LRLQSKLTLAIIPILAIPVTLAGFLVYFELRAFATERSVATSEAVLQRYSDRFEALQESVTSSVNLLASDPLLRNYLLIEDPVQRYNVMQPVLLRHIEEFQAMNPAFYDVRIFLRKGAEDMRSIHPGMHGVSESPLDPVLFGRLISSLSGGVVTVIRHQEARNRVVLYAGRPVYPGPLSGGSNSAREVPCGYLVALYDLSKFADAVYSQTLFPGGGLFLADDAGDLLMVGDDPLEPIPGGAHRPASRASRTLPRAPIRLSLPGAACFRRASSSAFAGRIGKSVAGATRHAEPETIQR
jgi:hypothetical protein